MIVLLFALLFSSTLEERLAERAEAHWKAREAAAARMTTAEAAAARGAAARAWMLTAIGGLPETKTSLGAKITGGFIRDGYRVENIIFESIPGFRVTANLYIPTNAQPPFPAVLGVAGHSVNGKASATYQKAWIAFVKRGYAVLAYDPPGQGERLETIDEATGLSRAGVGTPEHIQAGLQCLLTGTTIARYFVWDGIRAFDYLATRPEIDSTRIAVAGNSGGGTQAAYLAALEPRLAAAVSSCYMTRWRELWAGPGPQDAEQIMPGMVAAGYDFADFALAFAPKPFLITSAIRDYFPIAGARATYSEIVRAYERMGVSSRAGFFEYDDTHGWSQPRRTAAAQFLDKHLARRENTDPEPVIEPEPEGLLYATPTGQLQTSFGSETVTSLNLQLAERLHARRKARLARTPADIAAIVSTRLGLAPEPKARWRQESARAVSAGLEFTGFIEAGDGESVPAVLFESPRAAITLVLVGEEADARSLAAGGVRVLLVKPRGFAGNAGPSRMGYSPIYQLAARGWLLGESTPKWAVDDLRAAVAAARAFGGRVGIGGRGGAGVIALLTAAVEPSVAAAVMESSPLSYMDFCRAKVHTGLAELVIPGVLEDFDLPDIARAIAPKLLVVNPRTPTGARLPPNLAVRRSAEYGGTRFIERGEEQSAASAYGDWLKGR